ncbi:hypothetical protein X798_06367 [Onchocerca flexuosa]|uniref:Sulfotransfer_1 domain-containing protein n=1 Tax=Onchocerca flexuosa TaxID=387005 RepID=A0A238BPQ0_9BILA|nr:hypothetical protein X798_06367 [Onchocerca flexuosa]
MGGEKQEVSRISDPLKNIMGFGWQRPNAIVVIGSSNSLLIAVGFILENAIDIVGKLYNANMPVSIPFTHYFIWNIILILTYQHHKTTAYGINMIINDTTMNVQQKRFPHAIIIGVKKAGTRALLEFLRLNPAIKAPGPELKMEKANVN